MSEKFVIRVSLLLFALVPILLLVDRYRPRNTQWATISSDEQHLLRSGDVLFTEGVSFKSDLVRVVDGNGGEDSNYSHCGLIYLANDTPYVVHMSIDKDLILKEPLHLFWENNKVNYFALNRVRGEYPVERMEAALDSLLAQGVHFDDNYDATSSEELYCTELICHLFESLYGVNLYSTSDKREVIYPTTLYKHSQFYKLID